MKHSLILSSTHSLILSFTHSLIHSFSHSIILSLTLFGCSSPTDSSYAPKPKAYPRLDLPSATYQPLRQAHPYWFEYSTSAVILPDTFARAEPHWIFISYPSLNASIQLTYKSLTNKNNELSGLIGDAYKLVSAHQVKASGVKEQVVKTKTGRLAVVFGIDGDVASPAQFFSTDTSAHYLRGAVYLSTADKQDSLRPVIDYLRKDMMHLLNTLQWREKSKK
jgi:gliding motility-associated lipoprotein GldD